MGEEVGGVVQKKMQKIRTRAVVLQVKRKKRIRDISETASAVLIHQRTVAEG